MMSAICIIIFGIMCYYSIKLLYSDSVIVKLPYDKERLYHPVIFSPCTGVAKCT